MTLVLNDNKLEVTLEKSNINEEINVGELVELNIEDNKFKKVDKEYSPLVVGVCSEQSINKTQKIIPYYYNGIDMSNENSIEEPDVMITVCFSGLTTVKIDGTVAVGDQLVSSDNGRAKALRHKCDYYNSGKIIGKVVRFTENEDEVLALITMS